MMKNLHGSLLVLALLGLTLPVEAMKEMTGIQHSGVLPTCMLRLKWPEGKAGFATVVNFHGGGLVKGSVCYTQWPEEAVANDHVALVGVQYRLMSTSDDNAVTPADCIDDVATAVEWTLRNIACYGGNPKKVFVTGNSTGDYLTAMIGMAPQWLAKCGYRPTRVPRVSPKRYR